MDPVKVCQVNPVSMTACMKHNKTRNPELESIPPATFRFRPACILSKWVVLAWLLLGASLYSIASGAPGHDKTPLPPYQINVTTLFDNAIAGSGVSDIVRIQVIDLATGLPAPNVQLNITIAGSGVYSNPSTNASGYYDYQLTSALVQSKEIDISVLGGASTSTTFNWIAGPPDPNPPSNPPSNPGGVPSYFIVIKDNAAADGVDQDIVQIHTSNGFGATAANTPVTLVVTSSNTASGTAMLNLTTTMTFSIATDGNGNINIPITDINIGDVTLEAYINGNPTPIGVARIVHFVTGPPDPSKSYIVVTKNPAAADGTSQDEVTAYLFDAQGHAIQDGTPVSFTTLAGTATMLTPGSQACTTGSVPEDLVSNTIGYVQVQGYYVYNGVTYLLQDQANPANNFVTIQFTSGPPDPSKSYIVVTQDNAAADGTSQNIVTAYLFDAQGRPVNDGTPVSFTIQSGSATMLTTTSQQCLTGTVTEALVSPTVGAVQVQGTYVVGGITYTLTDQVTPANNYVTVHFVVGPPDLSKSYIVVTQDNAMADGTAQDIVKAYLFDAQGRAIMDGTPVTFAIQNGTATMLTPGSQQCLTGSVGEAFVSTTVGAVQVQGSYVYKGVTYILNDQANPTNNYVTIHFVVGPPVPGMPGGGGAGGTNPGGGGVPPGSGGSGSGGGGGGGGGGGNNTGPGSNSNYTVLFVRKDFQLADGTHQDSVIAYISDGAGHALQGVDVTFIIQNAPTSGTATAGAQFVGSSTVTTKDSGMARIALTSTTPGTVYVVATIKIGGVDVLVDGSYQILTFLDKPDVNNPATQLIVVVYEALADGQGQTIVKAHVVDLSGNIMPGQDVTFAIDSGDAKMTTPATATTDANGDAYITLTSTKPGFVLITATVGGEAIKFGSPARVKFAMINIYVPKVFTPNNDGTNDILKPILVGITEFHYMSVYNRWGNLIFTTQDPNRGWDGTFKGVAQPVESYLWIAEGVDINGNKIVQKGVTSLVR